MKKSKNNKETVRQIGRSLGIQTGRSLGRQTYSRGLYGDRQEVAKETYSEACRETDKEVAWETDIEVSMVHRGR